MVEVFKTNVTSPALADLLIYEIHQAFPHHRANFDLQDCDHILRVASSAGPVQVARIIDLLRAHGFYAEPLPDEPPSPGDLHSTELTLLGSFREMRAPDNPVWELRRHESIANDVEWARQGSIPCIAHRGREAR